MNPKASHALVGAVAFVLGAVTLHWITLQRIAAVERDLLAESAELGQAEPVDLVAVERFAKGVARRRAILSAQLVEDVQRRLLKGVERHAATIVNSHSGRYDHAQFLAVEELLRRDFADSAYADALKQMMELERAKGIQTCYERAQGRHPLEVDADCIFQDPQRRAAARQAIAARP